MPADDVPSAAADDPVSPDDEGRDADGFLTPARVRGLFDRAVVHFNATRFFESHEDWETIWHECEGAHRLFVQGLIQLAAAFHHVDHGTASGLVKLLRSSCEKLAAPTSETHGLDVARLAADLVPWWAFGERVATGAAKRGPLTPPFPTLRYVEGRVPAPLPPEPHDDESPD
ncbi:MAG: DUF309 domain-containing protein [Planctomycetota bacterium]